MRTLKEAVQNKELVFMSLIRKFEKWEKEFWKNQDIVDNGGYPECFKKVDNAERIFIKAWKKYFKMGFLIVDYNFAYEAENTMSIWRNNRRKKGVLL